MDAVLGSMILLAQKRPDAEDVVAGWVGAVVLLLLVAAVVVLAFSLVRQLRKADRAEDAGVYDEPSSSAEDAPGSQRESDPDDGTSGSGGQSSATP